MFDVATTEQVTTFTAPASKASTPAGGLQIGVASTSHPARLEVESFIKGGFKRAHNADIHSFMPTLLFARDSKLKSALGIRTAKEPLFVEQYLSTDLETTLAQHGVVTSHSKVVEIGNLHSVSARLTQQLLLCTAMALHLCEKEVLIFTGIPKVTRIFEQFEIPLTPICPATEKAVANGPDQWGTYYQDNPKVIAVRIADVLAQLRTPLDYANNASP